MESSGDDALHNPHSESSFAPPPAHERALGIASAPPRQPPILCCLKEAIWEDAVDPGREAATPARWTLARRSRTKGRPGTEATCLHSAGAACTGKSSMGFAGLSGQPSSLSNATPKRSNLAGDGKPCLREDTAMPAGRRSELRLTPRVRQQSSVRRFTSPSGR